MRFNIFKSDGAYGIHSMLHRIEQVRFFEARLCPSQRERNVRVQNWQSGECIGGMIAGTGTVNKSNTKFFNYQAPRKGALGLIIKSKVAMVREGNNCVSKEHRSIFE